MCSSLYLAIKVAVVCSLSLPQCVPLSISQSKFFFSSMPQLPLSSWSLSKQHLFAGISFNFSLYNDTNFLGQNFFFLSLQPHQSLQDQSCSSIFCWLRHLSSLSNKITLSEFLLISLSTTTPTFLVETASSLPLKNHTNLFKSEGR